MEEIAIDLGWAVCTALLGMPAEACASVTVMRSMGAIALVVGALTISISVVIWLTRARTQAALPLDAAPAPLPTLPDIRTRSGPSPRHAVEVERTATRKLKPRPKIGSVR